MSGLVGRALAEAAVALGAENEHGEIEWSVDGWIGYGRQDPDAFVLTMVGAEVTLVTRMVGIDRCCLTDAGPGVPAGEGGSASHIDAAAVVKQDTAARGSSLK